MEVKGLNIEVMKLYSDAGCIFTIAPDDAKMVSTSIEPNDRMLQLCQQGTKDMEGGGRG